MLKLFTRKRPSESAPQLTVWERKAAELPGPPTAGLPYETYDQMARDSMVQTALTVKRLGVLAAKWKLEPADASAEAKARAEFIQRAFDRMEGSPLTILGQAMDAFAKGWSVQELVLSQDEGGWWLAAVRPKDPAQFGLELDAFGRIGALVLRVPGEEERRLPASRFVVYRNRFTYGTPKGRSDLDAVYPHWQAKLGLLKAWKVHLERFASPTLLGRFQRGLPEGDRRDLASALNNLARLTSLVFPNEVEVSALGGTPDASRGFIDAIDFHNREIARAVLGQTLTTDEGSRVGSLALGKVHLQVLMLQLQAIRRELADTVMTEQVIRPLVEMNFGPGLVPRFAFEEADVTAFVTGQVE